MAKTKIEWATRTWNPITASTFHQDRLNEPLRWRKPSRIFVCSTGDLFHKDVPSEVIEKVWSVMLDVEHYTFLVLTKWVERMTELVGSSFEMSIAPNIWLGVTAENQAQADERIPILLQKPEAIKFVSVEPMLEPMDLTKYIGPYSCMRCGYIGAQCDLDEDDEEICSKCGAPDGEFGRLEYNPYVERISWVICGCESGPGARPMHPDWVRSLRDQCQEADVPFFLKQMQVNGKIAKMPKMDGKVWDGIPKGGEWY